MSTFAQFRAAWDAWVLATLPTVPYTWTFDPQPMVLKLPVRLELDGPHTISGTGTMDAITYVDGVDNTVQEILHTHRTATMTIRAVSRDFTLSPAELTLERVRVALRSPSTRTLLSVADIAIQGVGPTARYTIQDGRVSSQYMLNGRQEAVAACEVRLGWLFTDDLRPYPAYGTIGSVEITPTVDGIVAPTFTVTE